MDDVIIALQNIGLGSKLVNAALTEMGYALISFPEQNENSPSRGAKERNENTVPKLPSNQSCPSSEMP